MEPSKKGIAAVVCAAALAMADDEMDVFETITLAKIAEKEGLNLEELEKYADEVDDSYVPTNTRDRVQLLDYLLDIMFADDVIDKRECDFLEEMCKEFGWSEEDFMGMLESYMLEHNINKDDIRFVEPDED